LAMHERPPLDHNWRSALRNNPTRHLSLVVCRQSFPGVLRHGRNHRMFVRVTSSTTVDQRRSRRVNEKMNLTKGGNLCQPSTERSLNSSERTGTFGRLLHPMRLCVALMLTSSVPGFSQIIDPPPRPAPSPTWTELDLSFAPSARLAASMAFDPVSGKLILFGGFDGNKFLSDTWTFDGQSWSKVAVAQRPHGRTVAGMAYDAVSK